MDKETVDYFYDMEEMFATRGFQRLVEDANDAIEYRKNLLTEAPTIDFVRFTQGEITQLRVITNMETSVAAMKDAALVELEAEENEDAV